MIFVNVMLHNNKMKNFNKTQVNKLELQQVYKNVSAVQNKEGTNLPQQTIIQQIESDMDVSPFIKSIRYKSQRTYMAQQSQSLAHFDHNMLNNNQIQTQEGNLFLQHTRSEFASGYKNITNKNTQIKMKQSYLQNLDQQIKRLKYKIGTFQHSDNNTQPNHSQNQRTNQRAKSQQYSRKGRSSTVQRNRQRCGKIFRKQQIVYNNKNPKESTYYKWYPLVQQDKQKIEGLNLNIIKKQNPWERVKKSISSYRTKHRVVNNLTKNQPNLNSEYHHSSQIKQQQKDTKVSIFRMNVVNWQIKNISDNFRYKILKKLQIPSQFPLDKPSPHSSMEDYRKLSKKVYDIFGIHIQNIEKMLVVRKFKNGIYFQLQSDRNVVWYFSGVFYLGSWDTDLPSQGQKNGFGFQYVPDKYIYLGYFKAGTRNGHGVIQVFSSNKEQGNQFMGYDGQWVNGKPHGYGKQIDQMNTKYMGSFDSGEKTGHAIILSRDEVYYEGQVYKGLKQGMGMERLANGDTYNGQFHEGKLHGKGTYKWKDGSFYEGQFVNGLRQGKGIWKSFNGDEFQGQYFQDLKNGWGKFKWSNGQLYQGYFKSDKRDGEGTYRHPNGKTGKFLWQKGQIVHRLYCKEQQRYRCRLIKQKNVNSQA